jgi:hypothetical protein
LKWCQQQGGHDIGGPNAPNCVFGSAGGGGSSVADGGGTPAIIVLLENMRQDGIKKKNARIAAYNALVEQASAQARAGNIDEFNRIIRQAHPESSEVRRQLPKWIRDVNYRHYVGLAETAQREQRYLDAAEYFRLALPFLKSKDDRESLQKIIKWHQAADLWVRANKITSSAVDQVAMYDRALDIDPTMSTPEGRAHVEWLRGRAAEERGKFELAWALYRDALPLAGNDTTWNREKLIELNRRLHPPPKNESGREQMQRYLAEDILISLLAGTGDWDRKERARFDEALHHLQLDVDRSGNNDAIATVWGGLYADPPADLVADASRGKGAAPRITDRLQSGEDCAIHAMATASGRSYEDVAAIAATIVQRGSYRASVERNEPMKVIKGQGLFGGEVIALAEILGAVEIVPPNRFVATLQAGRPLFDRHLRAGLQQSGWKRRTSGGAVEIIQASR